LRDTSISWTENTFNIVWGCVHVSPACEACYANEVAKRYAPNLAKINGLNPDAYSTITESGKRVGNLWGANAARLPMSPSYWAGPYDWNAQAARAGRPQYVFACSMCDLYEVHPVVERELTKLWPIIQQTPWLRWLLLTKRYDQIRKKLPQNFENAFQGVTVESQEYVYRITDQVEWLSCEPLLGPIDLRKDHKGRRRTLPESLKWVIVGGESGAGAREMRLEWVRDLEKQCMELGLVFHFKQTGQVLSKSLNLSNLHGKKIHEWKAVPELDGLRQDWPAEWSEVKQ
jgi:protein gp37